MTRILKFTIAGLATAAFFTAGPKVQFARAQNSAPPQTTAPLATKQKEKNLAAGEVEAKRLLLLMDRDSNGKVSHKEFIAFMEEEFQRLDVNKDGELDVQELTRTRLTPHGGTRER